MCHNFTKESKNGFYSVAQLIQSSLRYQWRNLGGRGWTDGSPFATPAAQKHNLSFLDFLRLEN